jgi:hypothetical protein
MYDFTPPPQSDEEWVNSREIENLEDLISLAARFSVQLYRIRAKSVRKPGTWVYQAMPNPNPKSQPPDLGYLIDGFWKWHLNANEQFFPSPIIAGWEFCKQFRRYVEMIRERDCGIDIPPYDTPIDFGSN